MESYQAVIRIIALLEAIVILAKSENEKAPVNIKIVEAPALSRFPSMPGSSKQLTLRAKPSPLSGPPHLLQLSDKCYTGHDKGYTYKLCMFNNITQKEDRSGWNSFHGVLGVWHEWIIENDTFAGMYYTVGESCGLSDRESKVMFNCSSSTHLHNFTEPKTCSYHMVLDTPLACFKGAMQVYHMLLPDQLEEWDRLNHLFHAEELTFKGLTKKRRKLLITAGLLQEESKEEITSAPSPAPSESPASHNELSQCMRDKGKLESHIKDLKVKVLQVVKDYPELHTKLGLIFNHSTPYPPPSEQESQAGGVRGPDHDQLPEQGLDEPLDDYAMDTLVDDVLRDTDVADVGKRNAEQRQPFNAEDYDLDAFIKDYYYD